MNNIEILASHKRMYSWLKERASKNRFLSEDDRVDWYILEGYYPELLTFLEDLISNIEKLVNREQELLTEIEQLKTPSDREELRRNCERFVITDKKELEKENKSMWFPHKGYKLEIESKEENEAIRLIGKCKETGFRISTLGDYDYVVGKFKEDIDNYLVQKEIDELKAKEAREVPDLLKSIDEKLEQIRQEFRKSNTFENQPKDCKGKDEDVVLVEQFHLALKTTFRDMNTVPLITHPNREEIQTVKLNKIYELYKAPLRLSTFESFVKYYFSHYKYLNQ